MSGLFVAVHGSKLVLHIIAALALCGVAFGAMQFTPKQFRRHVIIAITFIGGLYYALEFFLPIHAMPTPKNPDATGNFLTPSVDVVSNWLVVVGAFASGLGVINLSMVHGKRLTKGGNAAFNSAVFFTSMIAMTVIGILRQAHPNAINANLFRLLFEGGLTSLDAAMFSIIAFYIVSASYRAFRVRSAEATILLVTAIVVMMGQIAIGQWLTHKIPDKNMVMRNLHFEAVGNWVMQVANASATRAISFGLGIGGLAVALRIWLGLERGSYFDG